MKYNVWCFIWDTFEFLYRFTGLNWQRPIEYFYPDFGPWLFGKMIGSKGKCIKRDGGSDAQE